jgi:hypothetical protein
MYINSPLPKRMHHIRRGFVIGDEGFDLVQADYRH